MTDSNALQNLARWRLSNLHRGFWQFLFTPVLALAFAILMLRGDAEDPRKNHIESKKALLALAPPPVPDAENAALNYNKAFKTFVGYTGPQEDDPVANLNREGAFFENPAVSTFLSANAAAFSLIEMATDQQQCNWNLDYSQGLFMTMNHYSSMRHWARMLCLRARLHAHLGEHLAAAADLKRASTLARHMSGDRTLLNALLIVSIHAIADAALQSIVIHDTPTKENEIEAYRSAMKCDTDPFVEFCHIWEGESILQAEMTDRLATIDEDDASAAALFGIPKESAMVFRLFYGSECKTQRAIKDDMLKSAQNGEWLSHTNDDDIIRRNKKGMAMFRQLTMPALSRAHIALARDADSRRCMDTAMAVLQFRTRNSRDPKSLDELVPEFLSSVPVDAFTKKPLAILVDEAETEIHFKGNTPEFKLPPGVLRIYSFGQNGMDDRGRLEWAILKHKGETLKGDDTVFFLPPIKKQ